MNREQPKTANYAGFRGSGAGRGKNDSADPGRSGRRPVINAAVGLLLWAGLFLLTDSLCWFQSLFGIPCPGCGSTRAAVALFHGDLAEALDFHPLILLSLAVLPYAALREALSRRWPIKPAEKVGAMCVVALYIIVFIIRMILLFPHTQPMVPLEGALWPRLIRWIWSFFSK